MKRKQRKKRLYLDVCTLCRPFDDQSAMRIHLETDAFYLILQNIQNGSYDMVVSPVHIAEVSAIKAVKERIEVSELLKQFEIEANIDLKKTRVRAEELVQLNFGVADAAHIAFAEASADFFISCDDKLLKKCKRKKVDVIAVNPVEFSISEDLK